MKRLLLLLTCVVMFIGCEKTSIRQGRQAYKDYFNDVLKDPESLRIYNEKILESDDNSAKFEIEYGAKNSYGAYIRATLYFYTIGAEVAKHSEYYTGIFPRVEQPAQKKTYPDKYTECQKKGLLTAYRYFTHLVVSNPQIKYAKGQSFNIKSDVLAIRFGSWEFEDVLKDKKIDIFNKRFYDQDYLILPKGTSVLIEDVSDDFYSVRISDANEEITYHLPLSLD